MLQLKILGSTKSPIWLVDPIYTIGSAKDDITLNEKNLESSHIQLQIGERHVVVSELGASVIPIFINSRPLIGNGALMHGDILSVGSSRIQIFDSLAPKVSPEQHHIKDVSLQHDCWRLVPMSKALENNCISVESELTVGRDNRCDIVLNSQHISKSQARFFIEDGQFYVTDLNSSNGTFVNKKRIRESVLHDGDQVLLSVIPFKVVGPRHTQPKVINDPNKTQLRQAIIAPKQNKKTYISPQNRVAPIFKQETPPAILTQSKYAKHQFKWLFVLMLVLILAGSAWFYISGHYLLMNHYLF